jgi:hypothetical protein
MHGWKGWCLSLLYCVLPVLIIPTRLRMPSLKWVLGRVAVVGGDIRVVGMWLRR